MKNSFRKKPLSLLLGEMDGEHRLNRVLGPVALTSLGVGAIIGTGIVPPWPPHVPRRMRNCSPVHANAPCA